MARAVGVLAMEHVSAGLVEDHRVVGEIRSFPEGGGRGLLQGLPAEQIAEAIRALVEGVSGGAPIEAVGVGFPGIVRDGVIEDSPNLKQIKGFALRDALAALLGGRIAVHTLNDADAFAAGVAATRGMLDSLVRVWTLGSGIGFGRYPNVPGVWEGGHLVVSLDPRERYCGCGGEGHLEGIVGDRAMRLRFLDLEPEEVFDGARAGDARCATFARLFHRALAAATANSIHFEGPGPFFFSGPNARFVDVGLVDLYLHSMVQMSPLQGSSLELLPMSDAVAVVGAAASALMASREPGR